MVKILHLITISLVCVSILIFSVEAASFGLQTTDISIEEKQHFWTNINFKVCEQPLEKESLVCFDISENGLIAVGIAGKLTRRSVFIYDAQWNFINRFDFDSSGDYQIAWDNESLAILWERGGMIALIDINGQCLQVDKIQNTSENSSLINKNFRSKKGVCDKKTYKLTNGNFVFDSLSSSYNLLVCIDENGNETIMHGNTENQRNSLIQSIVTIFFHVLFLLFVTFIIQKTIAKYRKSEKHSE